MLLINQEGPAQEQGSEIWRRERGGSELHRFPEKSGLYLELSVGCSSLRLLSKTVEMFLESYEEDAGSCTRTAS